MQLAKFFDNAADTWDEKVLHDPAKIRDLLKKVPVRPGQKVLDVGTGTGVLIPFILRQIGGAGALVAVDISPRMIEKARQKCRDPRISFLVADIEGEIEDPLLPESFDIIFCYSVFPHFSKPERALKNMHALLSPGGRLVVMHSDSREVINERHRRIGGEVGGHELPAVEQLQELGRGIGFLPLAAEESEEHYLMCFEKSSESTFL